MKKLLTLALCFAATIKSIAADSANDLILSQRNSGNTGNVQRNVTATANNVLAFNGSLVPFALSSSVTIGTTAVTLGNASTTFGGLTAFSFVPSSAPSAPASGFTEYADASGRRSWIRASDGFTRTWDSTLTANRIYALPDASVTIVGDTNVQTLGNKTLNSPVLVTPSLGVATATSINGNTFTSGTGTLTLGNNTLTASSNVTISSDGTGTRSLNISAGGTLGAGAFQPQTVLTGTANQIAVSNGGVGATTISITTNPTIPGNTTVSGSLVVAGQVGSPSNSRAILDFAGGADAARLLATNSGGAFTTPIQVINPVALSAKITTYNNLTTAGNGVPSIQGAGTVTAQTAASSSIATYTLGASDADFWVSGNVNVTASTTHTFTLECAYTDETNTARVVTFNVQQLGGTLITSITNVTGVGPYEGVPLHIRAKASTAITIRTNAGGTYTSVTYNASGVITKLQ